MTGASRRAAGPHRADECDVPAAMRDRMAPVEVAVTAAPPDLAWSVYLAARGVEVKAIQCGRCRGTWHVYPTAAGVERLESKHWGLA